MIRHSIIDTMLSLTVVVSLWTTGTTTLAFSPVTPYRPMLSQHQRIIVPTTPSSLSRATTTTTPSVYRATRRDVFEVPFLMGTTATIGATVLLGNPSPSIASYIDPTTDPPKITKRVFLDVSITSSGSTTASTDGRIVIGLYGDLMPRTVDNFQRLCESNSYGGTTFYRVVSDYTIQGGNIGDPTGKTGRSSFDGGQPFEPDNFNLKHTMAGLVSMVKATPSGGVDSRFFINCNDNGGWADDRYAAFGIVVEGMDLVKKIEQVPVQPPKNSPKSDVKIIASGVIS